MFDTPGVDLFLTMAIFCGAITTIVFAVALIYCVRYDDIKSIIASVLFQSVMNLLLVNMLPARRRINQIRMVRGPNKILLTLDDVTFINPSLSNKVSTFVMSTKRHHKGSGHFLLVPFFFFCCRLLSSWTPNIIETESRWQQSQWYEEHLRTQCSVPGVHEITGHPWELQHSRLWGDSAYATPKFPSE